MMLPVDVARARARLEETEGRAAVARRTDSACVSMPSWKRGQSSMAVPLM